MLMYILQTLLACSQPQLDQDKDEDTELRTSYNMRFALPLAATRIKR